MTLCHLLIGDLRRGCAEIEPLFASSQLEVDYLGAFFLVYQRESASAARRMVEDTCDRLRPIAVVPGVGAGGGEDAAETIAVGTTLFELYLTLKQLAG